MTLTRHTKEHLYIDQPDWEAMQDVWHIWMDNLGMIEVTQRIAVGKEQATWRSYSVSGARNKPSFRVWEDDTKNKKKKEISEIAKKFLDQKGFFIQPIGT